MREILFKAKATDNGEWVEGSLINAFEYTCILQSEDKLHPTDYPYLDGNIGTFDGRATPIIPETVGQYTGLTDKNGNKIFEGDIVKFVNHTDEIYSEEIGVCVFEQDECNFVLQRKIKNPENYHIPTSISTVYLISNRTYSKECWYEIIGNIHDKKLEDFENGC